MPPHKLKIKGAIIMLLRNLMPSKGLGNGTRLIVANLQRNLIEAKLIEDDESGTFFIPRIPVIRSDNNMPFSFNRKRFLIRLAFSMTINKSQGQTFGKISLVLTKQVFSHGQLYVVLSRVKSFDSLSVFAPRCQIYNCVFKEILNA
ncbi:ATP-dependent DNA helicase PIF1-like [Parasteatoda tepidariorum]|uniref:ATP-dependent DNA helicase PIF1-like n=1 Tax=Parasteatoda tepidariorum TaxID=114398 RepID=UPI0039BD12E7